jgi:hypothetical protein
VIFWLSTGQRQRQVEYPNRFRSTLRSPDGAQSPLPPVFVPGNNDFQSLPGQAAFSVRHGAKPGQLTPFVSGSGSFRAFQAVFPDAKEHILLIVAVLVSGVTQNRPLFGNKNSPGPSSRSQQSDCGDSRADQISPIVVRGSAWCAESLRPNA